MGRPWLEADIWQQAADHLTVPVQLVFDRGTEIIISLKDLLSPSDLFLILKPIIGRFLTNIESFCYCWTNTG